LTKVKQAAVLRYKADGRYPFVVFLPVSISSLGDPLNLRAMQADFIAYDLPADLMQDHGNILDLEMGLARAVVFVRLEVDAHTFLQMGHGTFGFDIADFFIGAEEEAVAVFHG
jgi:hypothetical protein